MLSKKFNLNLLKYSPSDVDITDQINFCHREPKISLGNFKLPLLFPNCMVSACRGIWARQRNVRISFQGLVTPPRRLAITKWLNNNTNCTIPHIRETNSFINKIGERIKQVLKIKDVRRGQFGPLLFVQSNLGRAFPLKAWDQDYYETLGKSMFILCPSGDYIWTYRFFESVLCGAIPIVESSCEAYEGFHYYTFDDKFQNLKYSERDASHNFELSRQKLSLKLQDLNAELDEIVGK